MQVKSLEQTKRVITDLYRAILFQFRLTRLQFPDPQQWINRRPFYFGLYSVVSWSYHIITHPHNEIKMNTYMMQCIIHTRMFVCHISSYDTRDYVELPGYEIDSVYLDQSYTILQYFSFCCFSISNFKSRIVRELKN